MNKQSIDIVGFGAIHKRSVRIAGHPTSISLEDVFWSALREIADARGQRLSTLVEEIDRNRDTANLSSAIRIFVMQTFRQAAGDLAAGQTG
jgi:predicted DNA-binding ribbon-helix-helix protein